MKYVFRRGFEFSPFCRVFDKGKQLDPERVKHCLELATTILVHWKVLTVNKLKKLLKLP